MKFPGLFQEKFQREFRIRLAVCLRRSPASGRTSLSRELSTLDSGRWDWSHSPAAAALVAARNGGAHGSAHGGVGVVAAGVGAGAGSGLSVLTSQLALTP